MNCRFSMPTRCRVHATVVTTKRRVTPSSQMLTIGLEDLALYPAWISSGCCYTPCLPSLRQWAGVGGGVPQMQQHVHTNRPSSLLKGGGRYTLAALRNCSASSLAPTGPMASPAAASARAALHVLHSRALWSSKPHHACSQAARMCSATSVTGMPLISLHTHILHAFGYKGLCMPISCWVPVGIHVA